MNLSTVFDKMSTQQTVDTHGYRYQFVMIAMSIRDTVCRETVGFNFDQMDE